MYKGSPVFNTEKSAYILLEIFSDVLHPWIILSRHKTTVGGGISLKDATWLQKILKPVIYTPLTR